MRRLSFLAFILVSCTVLLAACSSATPEPTPQPLPLSPKRQLTTGFGPEDATAILKNHFGIEFEKVDKAFNSFLRAECHAIGYDPEANRIAIEYTPTWEEWRSRRLSPLNTTNLGGGVWLIDVTRVHTYHYSDSPSEPASLWFSEQGYGFEGRDEPPKLRSLYTNPSGPSPKPTSIYDPDPHPPK